MDPNISQLKFIYLHVLLILFSYFAVYGFMPTVRYKNHGPANWVEKTKEYIVCAIAIGFFAGLFSYRQWELNMNIWATRFIEFIIPAFFGMYKANKKDGALSPKERIDIYHKTKDAGKDSDW